MKKVNLMKMFALMALSMSFIFFTGCDDDEDDDASVSIVGVWTLAGETWDQTVNGMTYVDYKVSQGMTEADAQAEYDENVTERTSMSGTIEMKDDGTFIYNWGVDDTGGGTWTLNSDKTVLTLTLTDGPMVFDVITLTASNLTIEEERTELEDWNEDQIDETVVTNSTMSFTR